MSRLRLVLAWASVGLMVLVAAVALVAGPTGTRWWLVVPAAVGVMMAMPAAFSEPRDLTPALLLSLAPVVALLSERSSLWLAPPLASMLLVAAEVNALSWVCEGADEAGRVVRDRLVRVGQLALLGLAGSFGVLAFGQARWLSGTLAVLAGAVAIGAVGSMVFRATGVGPGARSRE